jgi:hypothetical protein
MAIPALLWKLASPYDAYISHVSVLTEAIDRIKFLAEVALRYEAGLAGSVRLVPGGTAPEERVRRFREQLGDAAGSMSDEQFEEFISHLGSGEVAEVEANRAQAVSRKNSTQRGLEEYFGIAGRELALLEARGYSPDRSDVSRLLRENRLKPMTAPEFRHVLHELGLKVGVKTG